MDGEYIGSFGQSSTWDIFTPASWSHPRVPYEILTDPQSMSSHPVLEGDVPAMDPGGERRHGGGKSQPLNPCSPEDSILEVEMKEDINR
ncbi:hypothetical protein HPG69_017610, partial [Diceros bicornis minor]